MKVIKRIPIFIFFALLLAVSQVSLCEAQELLGRVVRVADGDTITILDSDHQQHRIRLAQIDAPEKSQPFGQKSKQRMSDLVFGRDVRVVVETTDRYGRLVGTVFAGGMDVNREMVRSGLAWVYRKYAKNPDLYRIEKKAREAKRGLWVDPSPTPPWEWRHASR